jgi:hypothetical protein
MLPMVGERGFEPPTPWSRASNRCTKLLFRLGLFYVLYRLSLWFSGTNGPKLDPNKKVIEPDARPGSGTYRVPDLYEFADTIDARKPGAASAISHLSEQAFVFCATSCSVHSVIR